MSLVYTQCDQLNEYQCDSNSECEWLITNVENYNCANFGSQSCENYSEYGCSWEFAWGGWQNYGSYCAGGTFQIDIEECVNIEILDCIEMNQIACIANDDCEWLQIGTQNSSCSSLNNSNQCNSIDDCNWTSYQQQCNWSGSAECESYPGCSYSYLTYSCSGTTNISYCGGGSYESPTFNCLEIDHLYGDSNEDGLLNISDIVIIVDLILNADFEENSDINQDGILNVIDVIELLDLILNI